MNLKRLMKIKDSGFSVVFIAHYPNKEWGKIKWYEKEFKKESEAYKFLDDLRDKYWWAKGKGWVSTKTIDNRTAEERALYNNAMNTVNSYLNSGTFSTSGMF